MPSGQKTDWAYSITTVPGTHTGQNIHGKYLFLLHDGLKLISKLTLVQERLLCHPGRKRIGPIL